MATLVSPGVSVSVTDESMYASAGPGTIPLIFIATAENKALPGDTTGSQYAAGTLKANAGSMYLITSQRELIQTFGNPIFRVVEGTPQHADERNEFGLFAAYSYLGIADRAYVIRGDINLEQLTPSFAEPRGNPVNGTYWFDVASTKLGVFRSNGGNHTVPYQDFALGTVYKLENTNECQKSILGTVRFLNGGTAAISMNGDLVIDGQVIALTAGTTVDNVITAINGAGVPNILADKLTTARGVRVRISNVKDKAIDITASDSSILADLGMTGVGPGDLLDEPLRAIIINGAPADVGVFGLVAKNSLNRIFEFRIPVSGTNANLDSTGTWFFAGSDDWRETDPSVILGTNAVATPAFVGTEAITVSVTMAGGVSLTSNPINIASGWTVAQVAQAIRTDSILSSYFVDTGNLAATGTRPLYCELDGSGAIRIENRDGGLLRVTDTGLVSALTKLGVTNSSGVAEVKARVVTHATHLSAPANTREDSIWVKTTSPNDGASWSIKLYNDAMMQWVVNPAPLYANDAAANAASAYGSNPTTGVLYVQYDPTAEGLAQYQIRRWSRGVPTGAWNPLVYQASAVAPTDVAPEGTLWYNTIFDVDIMVSDGTKWVGLNNHPWYTTSDIILNASKPTNKPDGSPHGTDLVNNDIWINTSDLENFPKIYRYNSSFRRWELVDNTDQTTPFGIIFSDARQDDGNGGTSPAALADSDFVDPDAPNPLTYPNGMLLFNTRFSTYNVKEWKPNHLIEYTEDALIAAGIDPALYEVGLAQFSPIALEDVGRWVTASGNQNDGSPWMGRKAQRQMVVRALAAELIGNQDCRSEAAYFNLLAAPGYTELLDEMVTLNVDKKQYAFIIGDTPARLAPDGTSIQNWATNYYNAPSNGDLGLTTGDTYVGLYYPWGLSTNTDGFEIMIPPSAIALRTYAYNDQVAYPWFAPAGFNRGLVSNAASVGYLTSEREYKPVILNQGQRDVLYLNKINPIAFMPNRGLVVYGQKTLHPISSALDRVNVVRLINYLRYQFDNLAKPFLFEPNDKQTRDAAKSTFERFMGDLITLRALYDFAIQCDEGNNTPQRIDRNELWIDVAIKPVKAIEFIYIPIRVLSTGAKMP